MTDARGMWWLISHRGVVATYGSTSAPATEHHTGHSTPVVGVQMSPDHPRCLLLKTASGNTWMVDADAETSTPGPEWRGLGTRLVQIARKHELRAGHVFGDGANMSLADRIAWHK